MLISNILPAVVGTPGASGGTHVQPHSGQEQPNIPVHEPPQRSPRALGVQPSHHRAVKVSNQVS